MNLQPSVIIWTVICFLLMMLVLDRLLFRPVLKILDERQRQLEEAQRKKEACEKLAEEQRKHLKEQQEEAARTQNARLLVSLEELQAKEKTALKDAHRECLARIDVYREQREKELEEILHAVNPKIAQVAELFAERIASDEE